AVDPSVTTVASGYSQGGAAVLDYALDPRGEFPDRTTLDYALALAPMGGTDTRGGEGIWAGRVGNTQLLSIAHPDDPARHIHTDEGIVDVSGNSGDFVESAIDFTRPDGHPDKRGYGALHSGYDRFDPTAGTWGYPMTAFRAQTEALFRGDHARHDYTRLGDWTYDNRPTWVRDQTERTRIRIERERREARERRERLRRHRRFR
ncbi:MAG: hypothetical protein AAF602_16940, partial [Myxococcota bacterium]